MKTDNFITVDNAIKKGFLFVNLPVFFCFALPVIIGLSLPENFDTNSITGYSLIPAFILAWTWWSWSLPKWRLWAVHKVEDVELLLHRAVEEQLMWRPGHFLQKTEISTRKQKEELKEILYNRLDTSDEYLVRMISNLTK